MFLDDLSLWRRGGRKEVKKPGHTRTIAAMTLVSLVCRLFCDMFFLRIFFQVVSFRCILLFGIKKSSVDLLIFADASSKTPVNDTILDLYISPLLKTLKTCLIKRDLPLSPPQIEPC